MTYPRRKWTPQVPPFAKIPRRGGLVRRRSFSTVGRYPLSPRVNSRYSPCNHSDTRLTTLLSGDDELLNGPKAEEEEEGRGEWMTTLPKQMRPKAGGLDQRSVKAFAAKEFVVGAVQLCVVLLQFFSGSATS
jgi:hypothetical protein